jgi:hypothetical protein
VLPEWADEAFLDPAAVHLVPDPQSRSGASNRTIGYSPSAGAVLVVITMIIDGDLVGLTAWVANSTDRRIYEQHEEE